MQQVTIAKGLLRETLDRLRATDPDDFTEEIEAERMPLDGTKW